MEESGIEFNNIAEPLTIELEGQAIRLSGSAEEQFMEWRILLEQIYIDETGFRIPETETE